MNWSDLSFNASFIRFRGLEHSDASIYDLLCRSKSQETDDVLSLFGDFIGINAEMRVELCDYDQN